MPLVAYSESGGGNKDTKNIGLLWEEIVKDKEFSPSRIKLGSSQKMMGFGLTTKKLEIMANI